MSKNKAKIIYCDYAASSPVATEVLQVVTKNLRNNFANASALHFLGQRAKATLEESRQKIAECLICRPANLIFTSGGTEGNNLGISGVLEKLVQTGMSPKKMHLITSQLEHSSILEVFHKWEKLGAEVTYLPIQKNGLIETKDLRQALKPNTVLVSLACANSEIGVMQPIKYLAKEIRHARKKNKIKVADDELKFPYFHVDASQSQWLFGTNTNDLGADMIVFDGQKMLGPKGVGVVFLRSGVKLASQILGGGQESGRRAGTENVPLIAGLAQAFVLAEKSRQKIVPGMQKIQKYFFQQLKKKFPKAVINGDPENRLPNNVNFSVLGMNTDFVVFQLAEAGIICSTKSACEQKEIGSKVVKQIESVPGQAQSTLRFTFGPEFSKKEVDRIVDLLRKEIIWEKI